MLVGIKMLIADIYHVPIACSLDLIAMILAIAAGASLLKGPRSWGTDEGGSELMA